MKKLVTLALFIVGAAIGFGLVSTALAADFPDPVVFRNTVDFQYPTRAGDIHRLACVDEDVTNAHPILEKRASLINLKGHLGAVGTTNTFTLWTPSEPGQMLILRAAQASNVVRLITGAKVKLIGKGEWAGVTNNTLTLLSVATAPTGSVWAEIGRSTNETSALAP